MIRQLHRGDLEEWRILWRGYQDHYEADLKAGEDELFERLMNPAADGPFGLVSVNGEGRLNGLTHYVFHPHTWSVEPRCYLIDLYTSAESRGQGVGRALILAVEEAAKAHGANQVYWLTQHFNEAGRRLYDKVGKLTPFIKYTL